MEANEFHEKLEKLAEAQTEALIKKMGESLDKTDTEKKEIIKAAFTTFFVLASLMMM